MDIAIDTPTDSDEESKELLARGNRIVDEAIKLKERQKDDTNQQSQVSSKICLSPFAFRRNPCIHSFSRLSPRGNASATGNRSYAPISSGYFRTGSRAL
jgi:hypothetical protein